MLWFLIDRDAAVQVPAVAAPTGGFAAIVAPVRLAVEQEQQVSDQINDLTRIAREENDFASEQFMQWFIKEQVEEVATMADLLTVVTRSQNDIEGIEDFVARDSGGERSDPTGPVQAGATA